MIKLFKYLKPYSFSILLIFIFLFVQANADLMLPDYMSEIVSKGIATGNTSFIWEVGFKMLAVSFAGAAASILVGLLSSKVAAGYSFKLRELVFSKVESFSSAEFDKFSTASLITRTTNDIQQIQMFVVMTLRMVMYAPIMGIGGVIKAAAKSKDMPQMTIIIVSSVAALIGLILIIFFIAVPKFKLVQKLVDKLNLVTRESLSGMLVIRAFNTQKYEENRFDKANRDLTGNMLFVSRVMSLLMPVMILIMNGVFISVIWVGAYLVKDFNDVANMMAFMQYAIQIIFSFIMVTMVFILLPRASVSGTRINEVLKCEISIKDKSDAKNLDPKAKKTIEFKNVSFYYPKAEEPMLKNISFTAKEGETTAIIGSTGSGKTTLINLIPRLYDVTEGEILINGEDIRNYTLHSLRESIGYVPQKGILFSGTVTSNLNYADENATLEEINTAAKTAQALEFIEKMDNGLDSEIARSGQNVSGGQKQRLSIARALVKKPAIYIFDDSFSALDFKTDAKLRKALKTEMESATVIIVAQRISTIMHADKILVLDNGMISGTGTHDELMATCEVYREITLSQLTKEELLGG